MFPESLPPKKTIIRKNVKKYESDDTSLNLNKGRSESRITTRTQKILKWYSKHWKKLRKNKCKKKWIRNIALVVLPKNKERLALVPMRKIRHHKLKDVDYKRRPHFCQWFLHQCNNQRFLANFTLGDKARFALNGTVNNHNVRMYAPANQAPDFLYHVNDSCQKLTV